MTLLASIPSPEHSTIDLGPLSIHYYGLMLLAAIAAAMWLTGIRYVHRGGNWDLIFQVSVWGVLAGVVGARLYHDATSWNEVAQIHHWWAPFAVWRGGLGIYGGILFGVAAGAFIVHRAGENIPKMLDIVAPALLLAQAVGRWGNYFNQELFGKPTSLPWGLRIDLANRPAGYESFLDLSADLPLRISARPSRRRLAASDRAALQAPCPGVSSLRRLLRADSFLHGAPADRSSQAFRRASPERLGLDLRLRLRLGLLHLVAVDPP